MGKFDVELMYGTDSIELGEFTYNHTVLQVKQFYYEHVNDSNSVDKITFTYGGQVMKDEKKLRYYNEDVDYSMVIVLTFKLIGGSSNVDNSDNNQFKIIRDRKFTLHQRLPVWNKDSKPPKYLEAKIIELYDTGFKIRWIKFDQQPGFDKIIFKDEFDTRLKDFRKDDDSQMDDIKEDNNDSNTNDVNQNASNNTNGNKNGDTAANVGKVGNIPYKIREKVQFKSRGWSWYYGIVTGFTNNYSGLIISYKYRNKSYMETIYARDFESRIKPTNIPSDAISKQPIGLRNFGNTCYFNSALQCLMSIPQLNKYIINLNNYPKCGLISYLKELYKGNIDSIFRIINECAKVDKNFGKNIQYDSVIAMNILLELIDKELMNNYIKISKVKLAHVTDDHSSEDASNISEGLYSKLTDQSKIRDLVYGIKLLMYTCLKCNKKSKIYKPFGYIALPLKSATISINVYPIRPRLNKQDKILKCDEAMLVQIRLKYKIKVFKDRTLNEILSKNNIINDNNAFDISIFTLNTSNKINKWITYYNDNDYCESFNNENYVFAQINAKNDDSFNVKCFDILYDKNNINDVEISVLKIEKDKNSIKGKKLYDHFGQKNCQDKLYIFHNNKFVRNESTVKVTNKSVLIFIWSNNINASVHDVSLENIVGSDNLKDIQDAKREVSKLIKTCQTSKFPIIRNNIPIENLTSEYQEMDKILQVYKLRDDILKLCGKNAKIKLIASKANTVEECLKILEEITPDNGIRCEGCNNKKSLTMNKQMCVLKTPKVLLLEIDREVQDDPNQFNQYSGYDAWGGYRKTFNDVNIKYPIDGLQFKDSIYNLYAISVHSGYSTNGGHYVSYVRREVNGKTLWYNCNDISISKMGEGTYNSKMRLQSNSAKLLVYIKVH